MGDLVVGEKNKYRDIKVEAQNSSIGDNNEVHQFNIQTNTEIKEALKNIEQEISKLKDAEEKNDAEIYFLSLSDNIQKNDTEKIKTCLKKLSGFIGNTGSLMTIASFFGLGIPGLTS
jgi:nucleoside phosphorylase